MSDVQTELKSEQCGNNFIVILVIRFIMLHHIKEQTFCFTSTLGDCVFASVCLFVCMSVSWITQNKKLWGIFCDIFGRGRT